MLNCLRILGFIVKQGKAENNMGKTSDLFEAYIVCIFNPITTEAKNTRMYQNVLADHKSKIRKFYSIGMQNTQVL